jgi:polar amino acid transport system substrate-binding protein
MAYLKKAVLVFLIAWGLLLNQQARAQNVSMVTTPWEPFFSKDLPQGGVITEIAAAAFAREGHQTSIKWYPWIRALKLVEYGSADVVMGAYYSAERTKKYLYSDPIFDIEVGLMALKDFGVKDYNSLQDLKGYNVGVVRGWVYSEEFDNADFLKKQVIINQIAAVRMLFAKRIDMLAASVPVFLHEVSLLKDQTTVNTKVLKPLLGKRQLFLMFNKADVKGAQLMKAFNTGLAKIRADGTFKKILAEHGF